MGSCIDCICPTSYQQKTSSDKAKNMKIQSQNNQREITQSLKYQDIQKEVIKQELSAKLINQFKLPSPSQPINYQFQKEASPLRFKKMRLVAQSDENLFHQGLPNIGNTCYLNSVLQFLYSSDKFKKVIQRVLKSKPTLTFHRLISNIFMDIANKQSQLKKEKDLNALALQIIQKKVSTMQLWKQNDAKQILFTILNQLQQQDPQSCSKLNLFKIEYEPRCCCLADQNKINIEAFSVKSEQKCKQCGTKFRYFVEKASSLLIVLPYNLLYQFKSFIQIQTKNGQKIHFENKGFVNYSGNGNSGHYIAHRKTQNGWLKISDSSVENVGQIIKISRPTLVLYQFCRPNDN